MYRRGYRIGLTGGIGSGKSTVARMLVARGATLVDADAISRSVTSAGGSAIHHLVDMFGPGVLTAEGAMDRTRMRQLIFGDPGVKAQLESIIHPLVGREVMQQATRAEEDGCLCIVLDIPLLVESGRWRQLVDKVLVVDCSEATQEARVLQRDGGRGEWIAGTVQKVMAGQASRAQRLAAADACIFNEGVSQEALERIVARLASEFGL